MPEMRFTPFGKPCLRIERALHWFYVSIGRVST